MKLSREHSPGQGAAILTFLYLISALISLVREPLLAAKFGADNRLLDAYNMAFGLPDFVFNILVVGAISVVFIPIFVKAKSQQGETEAWGVANSVMNRTVLTMISISALIFIFAPQALPFYAFGFKGASATLLSGENIPLITLTTQLTRLMILSPILFAISAIAGSIELSYRRFLTFGLAPIIYNIGILFGIIFLVPYFDIYGVAYGVIIGAILQTWLHWRAIRRIGFRFRAVISRGRAELKRLSRLMLFRSATLVSDRIEYLAALSIGSTVSAGITIFGFAYRIQSVPATIFGSALATAFFPSLSETAQLTDRTEFRTTFTRGVRHVLFFIIPISAFMIITRKEIAALILGFGKFGQNPDNVRIAASTLAIFSVSLVAQALLPIILRAYYALEDTKTPFKVAVVTMVINLGLAIALIGKIGTPALAIGFTVADLLDFGILSYLLSKRVGRSVGKKASGELWKSTLKICTATGLMSIVTFLMTSGLSTGRILSPEPFSRVTAYLQFGVVGLAALVIYLLVADLLGLKDIKVLWQNLKTKAD